MIQFEDSEYFVIIEDGFIEALIKTSQWWKERFQGNIDKIIVEQARDQMKDESKYIRFSFDPDPDTALELSTCASIINFIVAKKAVTIKTKWKNVRISEDSIYSGLNDNPHFIDALTKEYNTNYDSYVYYLPVSYRAHLVSKDESMGDLMWIHVDIPFSDIETC